MITYIRPNTKGYASERPVSFARVVKIDFDAMIYCLPLCFVIFSFSLLLFILRLTRHYFVQCHFPHFYCYFKIYIFHLFGPCVEDILRCIWWYRIVGKYNWVSRLIEIILLRIVSFVRNFTGQGRIHVVRVRVI